ncbi:MAG TPA: phage baseplate assembly protein V [Enhygromyxa sp.]|nr:phage baseplate assembly protein V [Enhygromyxa sp.]
MSGRADGGSQVYYGLYVAVVSDSVPDDLGRVEVELPWLGKNPSDRAQLDGGEEAGQRGDEGELVRIRATLMSSWASANQGFVAIPEQGSQVIVGFEAGNLQRPYIVGACWNGQAQMPHQGSASAGQNSGATEDRRVLRTKSGSFVELDDRDGNVKITISTARGHKLVLDSDGDSVEVSHAGSHKITLKPDGSIELTANNTVTITAPSGMTVTAPTATFSGDVICQNLIAAQGVVSPKYSPGFGNLL